MFSIYLIRNHEHIPNITYSPSIIYSLGPETKLGIPTLVGGETDGGLESGRWCFVVRGVVESRCPRCRVICGGPWWTEDIAIVATSIQTASAWWQHLRELRRPWFGNNESRLCSGDNYEGRTSFVATPTDFRLNACSAMWWKLYVIENCACSLFCSASVIL